MEFITVLQSARKKRRSKMLCCSKCQKPIHEENTKGIVYVIKGTEILYSDICGDCLKEKNLLLWQILMREIGEEA